MFSSLLFTDRICQQYDVMSNITTNFLPPEQYISILVKPGYMEHVWLPHSASAFCALVYL